MSALEYTFGMVALGALLPVGCLALVSGGMRAWRSHAGKTATAPSPPPEESPCSTVPPPCLRM
jgi:hypothetical protein